MGSPKASIFDATRRDPTGLNPEKISIISKAFSGYDIGYVALDDVKITCVPRENDFVKGYLPDLPIMDMQLD